MRAGRAHCVCVRAFHRKGHTHTHTFTLSAGWSVTVQAATPMPTHWELHVLYTGHSLQFQGIEVLLWGRGSGFPISHFLPWVVVCLTEGECELQSKGKQQLGAGSHQTASESFPPRPRPPAGWAPQAMSRLRLLWARRHSTEDDDVFVSGPGSAPQVTCLPTGSS